MFHADTESPWGPLSVTALVEPHACT